MCTLYNVTTNAEAISRLFKVTSPHRPDLPAFGDVYPNREGPVVRAGS